MSKAKNIKYAPISVLFFVFIYINRDMPPPNVSRTVVMPMTASVTLLPISPKIVVRTTAVAIYLTMSINHFPNSVFILQR